MIDRIVRAAKLDTALYEEVEHDKGANWQAFWIVVLSGLAAGLGGARAGPGGLIAGIAVALGLWLLWAGITLLVGTKLLSGPATQANYGQLMRTLGFAAAPGLIRVIGIIPFLYGITSLVASIWMLLATIVAVQTALDYKDVWRATVVVLVGWIIMLVVSLVFNIRVIGFR